jgi:hypothetical protein
VLDDPSGNPAAFVVREVMEAHVVSGRNRSSGRPARTTSEVDVSHDFSSGRSIQPSTPFRRTCEREQKGISCRGLVGGVRMPESSVQSCASGSARSTGLRLPRTRATRPAVHVRISL